MNAQAVERDVDPQRQGNAAGNQQRIQRNHNHDNDDHNGNSHSSADEEDIPTDNSIPDSEPHTVKYLGQLHLKTVSSTNPPTSAVCVSSIKELSSFRSRQRFRKGCAKWLLFQVSCARGQILSRPIDAAGDESGLSHVLANLACVADVGQMLCYVMADTSSGTIVCHAHVFECESHYAANYLSNELVKACQLIMEKVRLSKTMKPVASRFQNPTAHKTRETAGQLLVRDAQLLESAVKAAEATKVSSSGAAVRRERSKLNTGMYFVCCKSSGKCKCVVTEVVMTASPAKQHVASDISYTTVIQTAKTIKASRDPLELESFGFEAEHSLDGDDLQLQGCRAAEDDQHQHGPQVESEKSTQTLQQAESKTKPERHEGQLQNEPHVTRLHSQHHSASTDSLPARTGRKLPTIPSQVKTNPSPSTVFIELSGMRIQMGQLLSVKGHGVGTLRYYGPKLPDGAYNVVGIELEQPTGNMDGTLDANVYFNCKPQHGILFRPGEKQLTPCESRHSISFIEI
eukprot:m.73739 g.73739  ORF g.73739 m.73739 type:complete len:514 (-) comp13913_c0_seq1:957-2498(-)